MATNPFAGAGLGQMGQDASFSAGGSDENGIGRFLTMYGLEKSGAVDFLNKSLQPTGLQISSKGKLGAIPAPERPDVNPYLNTGMPASQPYAMPPDPNAVQQLNPHQLGFDFLKEARQ